MTAPPVTIIIVAFGVTIHLFLTTAIFRSANDSGMNGIFWALFYFFTLPVGLVAFFIFRTVATAGGGTSNMRVADPNRKRTVDVRRDFYKPKSVAEMLPRPSPGFHDEKLKELMALGEWDAASEQVDEMMSMAYGNKNRTLAEDYNRLKLWVREKLNPFESG